MGNAGARVWRAWSSVPSLAGLQARQGRAGGGLDVGSRAMRRAEAPGSLLHRRRSPPAAARPPPAALVSLAGKAGWIAGTTFLILIVPLIIEMDREQQV